MKKLADESALSHPAGSLLVGDSAFQGCLPAHATTWTPKKKPRGRELLESEKKRNRFLGGLRVGVEHALAGVKRCRIVLDTFRGWRKALVDEVMLAACGLHNLRVVTRQNA